MEGAEKLKQIIFWTLHGICHVSRANCNLSLNATSGLTFLVILPQLRQKWLERVIVSIILVTETAFIEFYINPVRKLSMADSAKRMEGLFSYTILINWFSSKSIMNPLQDKNKWLMLFSVHTARANFIQHGDSAPCLHEGCVNLSQVELVHRFSTRIVWNLSQVRIVYRCFTEAVCILSSLDLAFLMDSTRVMNLLHVEQIIPCSRNRPFHTTSWFGPSSKSIQTIAIK